MAKLYNAGSEPQNAKATRIVLWFTCPGCERSHGIHVPQWKWNGSMDSPTFTPSLLCNGHDPKSRCHSFITDGSIRFLSDSYHKLAGQTVPIPDWEGVT